MAKDDSSTKLVARFFFFWGGGGGLMEMPVVAETFGQVNPL